MLDDVAALACVAVLIQVVTGSETLGAGMILIVVGKAFAIFALVTLIGTDILKVGIRNLLATQQGSNSTLILLLVVVGTKLVFEWDLFISLIPETLALTFCLIVAQVSSAALSDR